MQNTTSIGLNRTGAQMSPLDIKSMQTYADQNSPPHQDPIEDLGITAVRSEYVHEAERIGSVPLPGTMTGAVTTGFSKLTGKKPEVLIDKLGERLAFERTGVRLYQALIDKVEASDESVSLPFAVADLEEIRNEELEHMHMLVSVIDSMGADPTAQTPSADVAGVSSSGVLQVLTDPRTTVGQCLSAVLTAELTDESCWDLLIQVTEETGKDEELLKKFRHAYEQEEQHVQRVRQWLSQIVLEEASS